MRLLLISSSFPERRDEGHNAGGFVRDVAEQLAAQGNDVTVITPQTVHDADGFKVKTIPRIGSATSLSHVDPSGWRGRLELASVLVMGTLVTTSVALRSKPDRIVAFWALPAGLMGSIAHYLSRTPLDVWALGSDIWRVDDYPLGKRLLRFVLRSADRRFADGTDLADAVATAADRPCAFLPSSRRLPQTTQSSSMPSSKSTDERVSLITVARFHPHKGVDVLVQAVGLLSKSSQRRLRLEIWGGGPDEQSIRELIATLGLEGTVVLPGFLSSSDFADKAATSDVAVIPSRLESIPVVLSDFAQINTPLIVSDTGDLGDLVAQHGAGIVVPAGDAASLAEAIELVIGGERPGSAEGRRALADYLSLDRAVETLSAPV